MDISQHFHPAELPTALDHAINSEETTETIRGIAAPLLMMFILLGPYKLAHSSYFWLGCLTSAWVVTFLVAGETLPAGTPAHLLKVWMHCAPFFKNVLPKPPPPPPKSRITRLVLMIERSLPFTLVQYLTGNLFWLHQTEFIDWEGLLLRNEGDQWALKFYRSFAIISFAYGALTMFYSCLTRYYTLNEAREMHVGPGQDTDPANVSNSPQADNSSAHASSGQQTGAVNGADAVSSQPPASSSHQIGEDLGRSILSSLSTLIQNTGNMQNSAEFVADENRHPASQAEFDTFREATASEVSKLWDRTEEAVQSEKVLGLDEDTKKDIESVKSELAALKRQVASHSSAEALRAQAASQKADDTSTIKEDIKITKEMADIRRALARLEEKAKNDRSDLNSKLLASDKTREDAMKTYAKENELNVVQKQMSALQSSNAQQEKDAHGKIEKIVQQTITMKLKPYARQDALSLAQKQISSLETEHMQQQKQVAQKIDDHVKHMNNTTATQNSSFEADIRSLRETLTEEMERTAEQVLVKLKPKDQRSLETHLKTAQAKLEKMVEKSAEQHQQETRHLKDEMAKLERTFEMQRQQESQNREETLKRWMSDQISHAKEQWDRSHTSVNEKLKAELAGLRRSMGAKQSEASSVEKLQRHVADLAAELSALKRAHESHERPASSREGLSAQTPPTSTGAFNSKQHIPVHQVQGTQASIKVDRGDKPQPTATTSAASGNGKGSLDPAATTFSFRAPPTTLWAGGGQEKDSGGASGVAEGPSQPPSSSVPSSSHQPSSTPNPEGPAPPATAKNAAAQAGCNPAASDNVVSNPSGGISAAKAPSTLAASSQPSAAEPTKSAPVKEVPDIENRTPMVPSKYETSEEDFKRTQARWAPEREERQSRMSENATRNIAQILAEGEEWKERNEREDARKAAAAQANSAQDPSSSRSKKPGGAKGTCGNGMSNKKKR